MSTRRESVSKKKRKASAMEEVASAKTFGEMNANQFISHARRKGRASLESSSRAASSSGGNIDLEHLVRTIRAIISTNDEIWERCRESRIVPPSSVSGEENVATLCFKDVTYTCVDVSPSKTTTVSGTSFNEERWLNFETALKVHIQTFNFPGSIPSELSNILSHVKDEDGVFPDYERFLETALLLNEDIVVPFLMKLQEHLEEVQVFLGNVDSWLMQSASCVDFIEEVFDVELDKTEVSFCGTGCGQKHPKDSMCCVCGQSYVAHNTLFSYSNGYHRCPDAEIPGVFHDKSFGSFLTGDNAKTLLKRSETSGEHRHTFHIMHEKERERLQLFLQFAS